MELFSFHFLLLLITDSFYVEFVFCTNFYIIKDIHIPCWLSEICCIGHPVYMVYKVPVIMVNC